MIKISIIGLTAVFLAIQLKVGRPEYEIFLTLAACLCIFFFLISKLQIVMDAVQQMQSYVKIEEKYIAILIKMIGITYIAEFSSNLCKDAGYQAIAGQIEMFGKIAVLAISMPVLLALIESIGSFLN